MALGGGNGGYTVNTSLSISEILHVCCFYDPVKLGFKPTATIPPLQILLTVILSTIFEKKKKTAFLMMLERRYCSFRGGTNCTQIMDIVLLPGAWEQR